MNRRIIALVGTAATVVCAAAVGAITLALPAAAAPTICDQFGSTTVLSGRYIVQNNSWGDTTPQCIDVNQTGPGFTVTTASHNKPTNGAPGAYPSIYFGCHYANCSTGSGLPLQASASAFAGIRTAVTMTYPGSGVFDAAYDIWFDPTPRTDGQNTGAEVMVWLNHTGVIQPVGSQVGTANIAGATWNVWEGNTGWNVISYVRQQTTTSVNFTVNDFFTDSINRGFAQRAWYLTSIQAGFEPWVGQTGLAVNSFSVTTGGSTGGDTQAPTTPGAVTASGITASSATLGWGAASDNTGVTGYDIFRAPGTSGGTFASVGTSTGTTFTNSGLTAGTSYRFQVRARDAAGNTSGFTAPVTVTTSASTGGGGTGGACAASYRQVNAWSGGFQGEITVTAGAAAINGWTATLGFPAGVSIIQLWNGTFTAAGTTVTVHNLSYNGSLAAGGATTFGFTANANGANGATPTLACTSP